MDVQITGPEVAECREVVVDTALEMNQGRHGTSTQVEEQAEGVGEAKEVKLIQYFNGQEEEKSATYTSTVKATRKARLKKLANMTNTKHRKRKVHPPNRQVRRQKLM